MLAGVYLYMAVMAFCTNLSGSKIFLPYLLLIMYLMISELYLKKENPVMNWAYSMLSQLYIALPFAMLNVLSFHTSPMDTSVSYNPILPLSVFVFIWLSDTGAYCVGSLIGRHRLSSVSLLKSHGKVLLGGRHSSDRFFFHIRSLFSYYEYGRMAG